MVLKNLAATHFGPFLGDLITFEPEVTVVTGANDTGKSSLLRLLKLICSKSGASEMTELDVNSERATNAKIEWKNDSEITAVANFYLPKEPTTHAEVKYLLAPDRWKASQAKTNRFSGALQQDYNLLPNAVLVDLGRGPQIREKIPLDSLNSEEKQLMTVAFGPGFNFAALVGLSDLRYNTAISNAERKLNDRLHQVLPPTLEFRFRLKSYSDKKNVISLGLEDAHGGLTELTRRGKGIQTLISLMGHLASEVYSSGRTLLLLDEPETHLHADAQHSLRRALELLGESELFQVIYATHSPCMVNTMRPQSIRLLTRANRNDQAVTVVNNSPFSSGMAAVRSSLGISPADSLLFAPITVLVEGKTEVLCLPILLKRLFELHLEGFDQVPLLLSQTVLIDAEGCSNIGYLCRLAKSHGAAVLMYVDGDQSKRWIQQLESESEKAPLIISKEGGEFEQIVPPERYFEALAKTFGEQSGKVDYASFRTWEQQATIPARLAFTKRIERWITDALNEIPPHKAEIMKIAVENTLPEEIDLLGLRKLISAMGRAISK